MELPNHAKQLLLQLNQQRAKGFLCDVIIVVENALFRAHKNILAASSMYFKSLVLHDNLINLDTDMVNPTVFRQILDFIYTGKLLSDQPGEQNFSALLTAASYLQLHDLAALCRKKLKRSNKPFAGRVGAPLARAARSHRLSATPVIQTRYSGSTDNIKGSLSKELQKGKVSDDEVFLSSSKQENCHALHQVSSKNGSNNSKGSVGDQELGLDLSKKSPPLSITHSQDDLPHNDSQQGSPQSASASAANSASFDDSVTNSQNADDGEPMEMEATEENHSISETGQHKNLRQSARKKEWMKKEGGSGGEESEPLPNGVIVGPLSKSAERNSSGTYSSEQSFQCKEDVENGKENSEESGQSENESSGHTSANYVYRQEGFEPVAYGDNLYVCIPCGKGFPSSEQLNAHVETHTEEELYIKEDDAYCKEEAEDLSTPNQTFSTESRPFKCSVCEKSYKDPATLRQHEKTHWLTRPFPCNICGKMFTQRGTMTRHMRSHLGLKPFACEECGMRFTRQYRLTEHMRVHSGEKPYECQLCGGKFTQQRNLISHLRMHTSPV
ncbi:hypermethylated in cancer 2 protein [Microcaecilia unicolor]|uniref:Hypermethylated in cancer 1 protein n=1 Tax=Microcaecilia unicolor TaxID=1415580 RepID=A0A6P7Z4N4_9AMPH|nr:hypermethylated in cancer 2 protein [Microcaecilia unicolor]